MLYKISEHEQYASLRKIKPQISWMQCSVELLERKMILHQNVTGMMMMMTNLASKTVGT